MIYTPKLKDEVKQVTKNLKHFSAQAEDWIDKTLKKCKLNVTKGSMKGISLRYLKEMWEKREVQVVQTRGASHKKAFVPKTAGVVTQTKKKK